MSEAAEYSVRDPLYRIRIPKRSGSLAKISKKDYSLETCLQWKPVFWAQLEAVRDRGLYLMIAGLIIVLTRHPFYITEPGATHLLPQISLAILVCDIISEKRCHAYRCQKISINAL